MGNCFEFEIMGKFELVINLNLILIKVENGVFLVIIIWCVYLKWFCLYMYIVFLLIFKLVYKLLKI